MVIPTTSTSRHKSGDLPTALWLTIRLLNKRKERGDAKQTPTAERPAPNHWLMRFATKKMVTSNTDVEGFWTVKCLSDSSLSLSKERRKWEEAIHFFCLCALDCPPRPSGHHMHGSWALVSIPPLPSSFPMATSTFARLLAPAAGGGRWSDYLSVHACVYYSIPAWSMPKRREDEDESPFSSKEEEETTKYSQSQEGDFFGRIFFFFLVFSCFTTVNRFGLLFISINF